LLNHALYNQESQVSLFALISHWLQAEGFGKNT